MRKRYKFISLFLVVSLLGCSNEKSQSAVKKSNDPIPSNVSNQDEELGIKSSFGELEKENSKYKIELELMTKPILRKNTPESQKPAEKDTTLFINNNGTNKFSLGNFYIVEKKINGDWYEIHSEPGNEPATHLGKNGSYQQYFDWFQKNNISPGTYRVVKQLQENDTKEDVVLAYELTVKKPKQISKSE